jgi:uncharacterized Zn finger protein
MNTKINPALCPDCSVPANFAINDISKKTDEVYRFSVKCRDCGDQWTEELAKE